MATPYVPGGMSAATFLKGRIGIPDRPDQVGLAPKRAPVSAPSKKAPTTGMAGLYGGLGPEAYINSLYKPLLDQNATQQAQRLEALKSLLLSFQQAVQAPSTDYYGAAASDASQQANAAAKSLAAANPNAATQGMLRAVGAPQAQQDAVSAQNNTVFNGQGALGQYVSGALPAGVFAADAQARGDYLKNIPLELANIGNQGIAQLASMAGKENQAIGLQKAQDLLKARSDLADFVTKNQSNRIAQAATVGSTLGYIPAGMLGNKKPITTLAGTRVDIAQQNADTSTKRANTAEKYARLNYGVSVKRLHLAQQKATQAQKSKGLTPAKMADIQAKAEKDAELFFNGIPEKKSASGATIAPPTYSRTWQQAFKTLLNRYPALGPAKVQQILTAAGYEPGVFGRPAFNKKQQQINDSLFPDLFSGLAGGK